jgi:hypothetical protein
MLAGRVSSFPNPFEPELCSLLLMLLGALVWIVGRWVYAWF